MERQHVKEPMRYRITIERITEIDPTVPNGDTTTVLVYQQTFDELNVAEMITRLNHTPIKRPRKAKAAK